MTTAKPKVLIPCADTDWQSRITLPKPENNVFGRVIRDPRSNSLNPKERECTEMLCALLRNSSVVRQELLEYFAELLGQRVLDWDELTFDFLTEQSIGSKRDDLRVMGWRAGAEEDKLCILWTIEVKVGASFHASSLFISRDEELDEKVEVVNQVINYDHWLSAETAEYRGGIVLSIINSSQSLPVGLQCNWACTSWSRLG